MDTVQIEIEKDIYDYLQKHARIRETESDILRRRLKDFPSQSDQAHSTEEAITKTSIALTECLENRRFRTMSSHKDRFLFILSCLHEEHPELFDSVTELTGRKRKYFAESSEEIRKSGGRPAQIPNTPFWADTNNSTPVKKKRLKQVMRVLGYNESDIDRAANAM